MDKLDFLGWEVEVEGNFESYLDLDQKKMILISKAHHSVFVTLKLDEEENLSLKTPWVNKVTFFGGRHLKIVLPADPTDLVD